MSWQIKANYICLFLNHQTQSVAFIIDFKQPLFFNCGKHSSKQQRKYEPYKSNGHVLFIYFYQGFPIILPHPLFKFHEIWDFPKKATCKSQSFNFYLSVSLSISAQKPIFSDTPTDGRHQVELEAQQKPVEREIRGSASPKGCWVKKVGEHNFKE